MAALGCKVHVHTAGYCRKILTRHRCFVRQERLFITYFINNCVLDDKIYSTWMHSAHTLAAILLIIVGMFQNVAGRYKRKSFLYHVCFVLAYTSNYNVFR